LANFNNFGMQHHKVMRRKWP